MRISIPLISGRCQTYRYHKLKSYKLVNQNRAGTPDLFHKKQAPKPLEFNMKPGKKKVEKEIPNLETIGCSGSMLNFGGKNSPEFLSFLGDREVPCGVLLGVSCNFLGILGDSKRRCCRGEKKHQEPNNRFKVPHIWILLFGVYILNFRAVYFCVSQPSFNG